MNSYVWSQKATCSEGVKFCWLIRKCECLLLLLNLGFCINLVFTKAETKAGMETPYLGM
jgi:hypothetical protein